jgi:4'-phosphopantetheinyl transferase
MSISECTPLIEWPSPSSNPSLHNSVVHVWAWDYECSAESLNRYIALLSSDERLRTQRFRFEKDRIRYTVSHAILRILLGRYLDADPSSIAFCRNQFGKPHLSQTLAAQKLAFNLSHTNRVGLLAIAIDVEIGVDIEEVLPVECGAVEQYFSPQEQLSLSSLEGNDWLEGFYKCWTRKEAILKAEGLGLNASLDTFDVSLSPHVKPEVLEVRANSRLTSNWHLVELRPVHGFIGALATNVALADVACYRFAN